MSTPAHFQDTLSSIARTYPGHPWKQAACPGLDCCHAWPGAMLQSERPSRALRLCFLLGRLLRTRNLFPIVYGRAAWIKAPEIRGNDIFGQSRTSRCKADLRELLIMPLSLLCHQLSKSGGELYGKSDSRILPLPECMSDATAVTADRCSG